LSELTIQQVLWRVEGLNSASKEKWRIARRICWVQAQTMGYKGDEDSLWKIDVTEQDLEDPKKKIERFRRQLKKIGKI